LNYFLAFFLLLDVELREPLLYAFLPLAEEDDVDALEKIAL
jgi:hypothetical protein